VPERLLRLRRRALLAVAFVAGTTATTQAQWIITPYAGINVAGDLETRRGGVGVSAGYFARWVGFEFDVERHGHFFEDAKIGNVSTYPMEHINTRATHIVANVVVPLEPRGATSWRPYGAAGFGLIRADFIYVTGPARPDVHQNDFAFNAGGGVIKSLNSRVGLRGDLRYSRAFADQDKPLSAGQIGDMNGVYRDYGFWQFTFGVTFGQRR
jgi:Outer membrane protein beta-barrel domain